MTRRLFVALWPDPAAVERLRQVRDGLPAVEGTRHVAPQNWHVTLRFLGETDPDAAIERLAAATLPPADVQLGPATIRLGARQIVAPAAGVDELAVAVREATAALVTPGHRPFVGHLTLARTRPGVGDELLGHPVDAGFAAAEVVLAASELHPDGAVYTPIGRFPTG